MLLQPDAQPPPASARPNGNRLVIEKPEQIKHRLKERFAQVPVERRLVDELIAEHREESRREAEG